MDPQEHAHAPWHMTGRKPINMPMIQQIRVVTSRPHAFLRSAHSCARRWRTRHPWQPQRCVEQPRLARRDARAASGAANRHSRSCKNCQEPLPRASTAWRRCRSESSPNGSNHETPLLWYLRFCMLQKYTSRYLLADFTRVSDCRFNAGFVKHVSH